MWDMFQDEYSIPKVDKESNNDVRLLEAVKTSTCGRQQTTAAQAE